MAKEIDGNLYRVSLDSERNYVYVEAENEKSLIYFLVDNYVPDRNIFNAKEVCRDGSLLTVPVVTNPLFQSLQSLKLQHPEQWSPADMPEPSLSELIEQAKAATQMAMHAAFEREGRGENLHPSIANRLSTAEQIICEAEETLAQLKPRLEDQIRNAENSRQSAPNAPTIQQGRGER